MIFFFSAHPNCQEHYWELLAEGQDVTPPRPGSSHPLPLEVGDTGETRALNEDIVEVIVVEEIVELRRGGDQ